MSSSRSQALQKALIWSLKHRTAVAVLAASGCFVLFTISRRIWRGGGKKAQDPGGTNSTVKVKEKTGNLRLNKEENPSQAKEGKVRPECSLKGSAPEVIHPLVVEEEHPSESVPQNVEGIKKLSSGDSSHISEEKKCDSSEKEPIGVGSRQGNSGSDLVSNNCSALSIDPVAVEEKVVVTDEHKDPLLCEPKETSLKHNSDSCDSQGQISAVLSCVHIETESKDIEFAQNNLKIPVESKDTLDVISEKGVDIASEGITPASALNCEGTLGEVVPSVPQYKAAVEPTTAIEEGKIEAVVIGSVACALTTKESKEEPLPAVEDEQLTLVEGAAGEVLKEVSGSSDVSLESAETTEMMVTKGVEAEFELVRSKRSNRRKGKKGRKDCDIDEEKMEVKELVMAMEETVIHDDENDLSEEHRSKCRVPSGHMDASSIGSPSMSNFPDNRSEGSSCGDSGKGRSDVTTPGGLDEELREVSFSHHYSPPCSTSGPDEEEEVGEVVADKEGADNEEGRADSSGGERDSVTGEEGGVMENGPVMPVAVPVYDGMMPVTPPSAYEFVIPQGLVGRLIGKHGSFVNLIKARTSATIFIKTHPETNKLKVCAIEGTENEIQAALEMIREKFPLRRYSTMTLDQVFFLPLPPPTFTLIPDVLHLQLVERVSNDVILSALVSPSHYFLQQPTHPTYPTLAKLDMWMAMCYQDANAPLLPEVVEPGIICAAPTMGGWYRAQIVAVEELPSDAESSEEGELMKWCDVRFVDYGGYERLPADSLRQIRSDFMTLPFQSSECYLAHVVPVPMPDDNKGAVSWSMEAYALVEELTQAQVLKALVVGHAPDGLPLVLLYAYSHSYGQVVRVNDELVNRGLAMWAMPMVVTEEGGVVVEGGGDDVSVDSAAENQPAQTASV